MNDKIIYRLDDDIYFRKCTLFEEGDFSYGDCTNFSTTQTNHKDYYTCNQLGIHFHCAKHMGYELECCYDEDEEKSYLICPQCKRKIYIDSYQKLQQKCLSRLNSELFKNAKLIRLDDWYVPEIKNEKKISNYWVKTDVKTDKDGDTIIVIYVGNKNTNQKAQLFIKPEKLQLSNDFKDLDPATVLSKIELTLRDRTIAQKYDDEI